MIKFLSEFFSSAVLAWVLFAVSLVVNGLLLAHIKKLDRELDEFGMYFLLTNLKGKK